MLGVFVPSVVSAYQQYKADIAANASAYINAWMLIAAVSFGVGLCSLIALCQSISHEHESIDSILAEMEEIQIRFTRTPQ